VATKFSRLVRVVPAPPKANDTPAAEELPARLDLDRSSLVTLIAHRGHSAQLHEGPEKKGVPSDDHA
jgi:hypothetical protein